MALPPLETLFETSKNRNFVIELIASSGSHPLRLLSGRIITVNLSSPFSGTQLTDCSGFAHSEVPKLHGSTYIFSDPQESQFEPLRAK